MKPRDLAWKQSLPTTCGAASLMIALAELKGTPVNAEREIELWRFANNGSTALPGSFPGRLALRAKAEGCRTEIFEDREKLEAVFQLSTDQTRFPGLDPVQGFQEHVAYLTAAEGDGVPVHRGPLTLLKVAELARDASVLMLVSTAPDVSGLHWVLLKKYDAATRTCILMEPALGKNFTGPLEFFLSHYSATHPFLGVAVTVR